MSSYGDAPSRSTPQHQSEASGAATVAFDANVALEGPWNLQYQPPFYGPYAPDADLGWQDDFLHKRLQDETIGPANVLRDLAVLAEQHTPADDLLLAVSPTRNKRKRSDEESSKRPAAKPPPATSEVRKRMNEVIERRDTAIKALDAAKLDLNRSQQQHDEAQSELTQAEQAVTEMGQQLCDDLLQENTSWNAMYRTLLAFREQYGHVNVPRNPSKTQKEADPDMGKLGQWVGRQRRDYRRSLNDSNRIEDYQIIALDKIGFDWDPHKTAWMNRYQDLVKFKNQYGHCLVPTASAKKEKSNKRDAEVNESEADDITEGDYNSLGNWVKRQKHQYKLFQDGDPASEMTHERIRLLEDIGFTWSRRSEQWMKRYNELKDYQEKHGEARPPNTPEFKSLWEWTKDQRAQMRRYDQDPNQSSLSAQQMKLLNELQLEPDVRASSWTVRFRQLMDFKRQHGHTVVPAKYPLNPKLANWVSSQRRHYQSTKEGKPSQMTEERAKMLTDAGFEWEVSSERREETSRNMAKTWDEFFAELCERKRETGTLDAGKRNDLRVWTATQRLEYERVQMGQPSSLTSEQAAKLEEIGIEDDMNECGVDQPHRGKSWEEPYAELLTHRLKHNNFQVPTKSPLARWIQEQRSEYEKFINGRPSALTSDRIQKLNNVRFPWKRNGRPVRPDFIPKSWEEMYGELLAFRITYQSFNVPKQNLQLCSWIATQQLMRERHMNATTKSELAEERIRKLDSIGFPWEDSSQLPSCVNEQGSAPR